MNRIETPVKSVGSSSNGTEILMTSDKKYIAFNSDKARKIVGLSCYLSEFLGNSLRVFTPAIIDIYDNVIEVTLTLENINFVVEREAFPEWFIEGKQLEELK